MSQKLTNDQLRETYFKNHTSLKSFNRTENSHNSAQVESDQKPARVNYGKFSDEEKKRFDNLFNSFIESEPEIMSGAPTEHDRFANPTQTTDFANERDRYRSQLSYDDIFNIPGYHDAAATNNVTHEVDLPPVSRLESDLRSQMKAQEELIQQMKAQLEINSWNEKKDFTINEELNGLMNGQVAMSSNSLGDIFAEIVENEQNSTSNYEESILDANIEQLFAYGDDIDKVTDSVPIFELPKVPSAKSVSPFEAAPSVPDFSLPTTPVVEVAPVLPDFDLPTTPAVEAAPVLPDFDLPATPVFEVAPVLPDFDLPTTPVVEAAPVLPVVDLPVLPVVEVSAPAGQMSAEQPAVAANLPKKRRRSLQKDEIFDIMLVIVFLAIIAVLVFHFLL